jgi:hypothetical protein
MRSAECLVAEKDWKDAGILSHGFFQSKFSSIQKSQSVNIGR